MKILSVGSNYNYQKQNQNTKKQNVSFGIFRAPDDVLRVVREKGVQPLFHPEKYVDLYLTLNDARKAIKLGYDSPEEFAEHIPDGVPIRLLSLADVKGKTLEEINLLLESFETVNLG